jgi:urease accessory protein
MNSLPLLHLLQIASPALPVGAYSYSEGLEFLVDHGSIQTAADLAHWLEQELRFGAIRVEVAVMAQAYEASQNHQLEQIKHSNDWLSAFRETEELRQQGWQMGRSLLKLLQAITDPDPQMLAILQPECNFAIAFAIAATHWNIDIHSATLGYLQTWATNLINAGIKLIPLGQTTGQQILLHLYPLIDQATQALLSSPDENVCSCGWGLALASMQHETQYTRLFRS